MAPYQSAAAAQTALPAGSVWTLEGHPLSAQTMPATRSEFAATSYGQALHSATRGRMRSAEVKKCKVESWLVTQAIAPAGVEMSSGL
jgi:hypothetical protein